MTKGKLLAIGAAAGAIVLTIFGFGIYGIVSCSSREYVERRITDSQNDKMYESIAATVVYVENDKDILHLGLKYDEGTYDAFVIPETKKYFQDNGFEFGLDETYSFIVFNRGEPIIGDIIAAVSSEDGKKVYLSYEDGKQMVTDYFISLRD